MTTGSFGAAHLTGLTTALADRYRLERALGAGGMATVWLAEDVRHRRRVAVKVLHPELSAVLGPERFLKEIELTAGLQHPHILPLFDSGSAEGLLYYVMPFVDGETLRARLGGGPLPVAEAVAVLRDVARALAYAHSRGVVHRDVKPENVLLSGGAAVVADFGVAKALSASRTQAPAAGAPALTQVGTSVGTPAYMAPEQAVGEQVDARADVYAWGVLAYELLAGRHPFGARTAQQYVAAHLAEAPATLGTRAPGAPPALAALAMHCLAKEPGDRPRAMTEVLHALDGASGARAAAAPEHPAREEDRAPSLAVLPFANLSADPEQEYFSDGMTEEVINALAHRPGLRVAARTSSFAFKGQPTDLRTVAERLGVRAVLEGSVRRSGARVRIAVQLVNAADGLHLWGERYDGDLADVFAVQDAIARAIADALVERLTAAAAGARASAATPTGAAGRPGRPAVRPEAYDRYLRGRFLYEQRSQHMREALACFDEATALDPRFALPHAWRGACCELFGLFNALPPRTAFPMARESAERALALDPDCGEAMAVLAGVALLHDWDRPRATALVTDALRRNPADPLAVATLGFVHGAASRPDLAIASLEAARRTDPLSDFITYDLAWWYLCFGRPERALAEVAPVVARNPASSEMRRVYALALAVAGRVPEALAESRRVLELNPGDLWAEFDLAANHARLGDRATALSLVAAIEARGATMWVPPIIRAVVHCLLGDDDLALDWLERCIETRQFWLVWLRNEPYFRSLRGHPRFEQIVRAVGVAPELDGAAH